jgi:RNA polymerase sigma factor (sigma-70 family)
MPSTTAATLKKFIRSVASAADVAASDRDLLHRFAREGDQAAFAALVRRHASMVLGVCQRALSSIPDAEDASQATFLILVRKAKSGRWQVSIANWLYATARKVAANARVAAQRRARREARAGVRETVLPVDMTAQELLAALDEELDKLPPRYREPLVLCYLEGLTRDEAAHRLEVPLNTVKIRLERLWSGCRSANSVAGSPPSSAHRPRPTTRPGWSNASPGACKPWPSESAMLAGLPLACRMRRPSPARLPGCAGGDRREVSLISSKNCPRITARPQ